MRDNQYFFVDPSDVFPERQTLLLKNDEAYHCVKVLRKKTGDEFYAVDGFGHEFAVVIDRTTKDTVECRIQETRHRPNELTRPIVLAQALIKKDHFEWVIEKATELGVQEIIPVRTQRSLMEPGFNKIQRWDKILLSAMKQSRRSVLPKIKPILGFNDLLKTAGEFSSQIIFHEKSDKPVNIYTQTLSATKNQPILLCIGPEGGFTDEEINGAQACGFDILSLGSRRLRAETAAIVALGIFSIR